jgi:transitional endoplasmic reticulum ATPase
MEAQNRLVVDEVSAGDDDNSVAYLSPAKMEELQLFRGDTVLLEGKKGKDTVCMVTPSIGSDEGHIRLNEVRFSQ